MGTASPPAKFRLRLTAFFLLPVIVLVAFAVQFQTRSANAWGLDYEFFHAFWIALIGGWLGTLAMMRFSSAREVDAYTRWAWTTLASPLVASILGLVLLAAAEAEVVQLYAISPHLVLPHVGRHLLYLIAFFVALTFLSLLLGGIATAVFQWVAADANKIASTRGEEEDG